MITFKPVYSMDEGIRVATARAVAKAYDLHIATEKSNIQQGVEPWEKRTTVPNGKVYKLLSEFYPNYSIKMLYNLMTKYRKGERAMSEDMISKFSELVYGEGNENFIFLDAYLEFRNYYDNLFHEEARRSSHLGRERARFEKLQERKTKTIAEFYDEAIAEAEAADEWS